MLCGTAQHGKSLSGQQGASTHTAHVSAGFRILLWGRSYECRTQILHVPFRTPGREFNIVFIYRILCRNVCPFERLVPLMHTFHSCSHSIKHHVDYTLKCTRRAHARIFEGPSHTSTAHNTRNMRGQIPASLNDTLRVVWATRIYIHSVRRMYAHEAGVRERRI